MKSIEAPRRSSDGASTSRTQPSVEIYRDLESLEAIRTEWEQFRGSLSETSSVSSFEAVSAWWKAFGPELIREFGSASLEVFVIREDRDRLLAIIPTYRLDRRIFKLLPGQIVSVGLWPAGSMERMMEEPTSLIAPEAIDKVIDAFGTHLADEFKRARVDLIRIAWADTSLGETGFQNRWKRLIQNWASIQLKNNNSVVYIRLAETWEAHRKIISKSMRDNLAYYPKLLQRGGHEFRIRVVSEQQDLPRAVHVLSQLHRERSVNTSLRLHKVHIQGPVQEKYLLELLSSLLPKREGFIAELVIADQVVASQAFLVHGPVLTVYYSGFDPEWGKFSPLFVLDAGIFKSQFEAGIRELNFLTVPGAWQLRWGPNRQAPTFTSILIGINPFIKSLALLFLSRRKLKASLDEREQHRKAAAHEKTRQALRSRDESDN